MKNFSFKNGLQVVKKVEHNGVTEITEEWEHRWRQFPSTQLLFCLAIIHVLTVWKYFSQHWWNVLEYLLLVWQEQNLITPPSKQIILRIVLSFLYLDVNLLKKNWCMKPPNPVLNFVLPKTFYSLEFTLLCLCWNLKRLKSYFTNIPRLRSRSKSPLIGPSQTSGTSDQTVPNRSDLWSDENALEDHCALEVRSKPPLIRRVPDRSDPWSDKFQTIVQTSSRPLSRLECVRNSLIREWF